MTRFRMYPERHRDWEQRGILREQGLGRVHRAWESRWNKTAGRAEAELAVISGKSNDSIYLASIQIIIKKNGRA